MNYREGNDIQNSLVWKGLIKPVKITLENTWIKLFDFTNKGKEQLAFLGISLSGSLRKGTVEHQYWINRVAEHYKVKGYRVQVELSIGGGKTIDLEVRKGNKVIAIEIETGKSDVIGNIKKCLKAGYESVICVITNWSYFIKIKELVKRRKLDRNVEIIFGKKILKD